MRVLITGGAGFIGSHLCEAMLGEGHHVVCVDNLITGSPSNIAHLESDARFEFAELDVNQPYDVGRVDCIFHFASPASPLDYMQHGIDTLQVGSLRPFHSFELARKYCARYMLASTSECYGDPLEHPQKESYWGHVNPTGPRSVYDEAKHFAEATTLAYRRYHGVNTRILRIFNTYGPRLQLNDGRVISNFMKQALRGEPLTVYGDGTQTPSFCYVSDEVEGILRLAWSEIHEPVNIGNPDQFTILGCAPRVLKVAGSKSPITHTPLPEDDPKRRCPDITRAKNLLGWEPKINLESGLRLSLVYFREALTTASTGSGGHAARPHVSLSV